MALDQETVVQLLMAQNLKLRAYAWLLVRDGHLADDLIQEVALIAIRKCDTIIDAERFPAWVRQTCRHVAGNQLRREGRQPNVLGDQLVNLVDEKWDDPALLSPDSLDALRDCLKKLSPYAQKLLRLRYHDDLKSAEIARRLSRSAETIYVALTRAHRALSECVRGRLSQGAGT
jgi:RNA polymerase sigma factor (sigma-70 family)